MTSSLSEPVCVPPIAAGGRPYRVRLAASGRDLQAAQSLRFSVFNLEQREGLSQSYATGRDADPFDAVCEHLIVEDVRDGAVVGTYRMQSGPQAAAGLGYYSAREFDLRGFEPQRAQILELGRACVHRQHRNFSVLNLLWKGIAAHARQCGARYLIGCSSLTSQEPAQGVSAYRQLASKLAPAAWRTTPLAEYRCDTALETMRPAPIPRLMSAYLALGAAVCGPPALDREFGTIDFLTWLDLESPMMQALQRRGRFIA